MDYKKILSKLSIPEEIVYDLPYITAVGNKEINIENYSGITEYTPNKTRIKTSCGILAIEGENLSIGHISPDEIKIKGTISKYEYL